MVKVLVVEDSLVVRQVLIRILESDPQILVVATAANGEEAIEQTRRHRPDLITMDIVMPVMDGLEATRRIMETTPVPIVVVSASWDPIEVSKTFLALEAGALAVLDKPRGVDEPGAGRQARQLVDTVKLMAEVKLVRRIRRASVERKASPLAVPAGLADSPKIRLVAMGASTGGPPVLATILSLLGPGFPVPILVTQHIAHGFTRGLADWLGSTCGLPVQVASLDGCAQSGQVYIAPDGLHLGVTPDLRFSFDRGEPENGMRPSVSFLFRSVAQSVGRESAGVLLSGMGRDGAEELKRLRNIGAVTIAQDEESSVVFGMPGEAVRLNAASHILPPERIAGLLKLLAARNATRATAMPGGGAHG